jgi:hypothetical protein
MKVRAAVIARPKAVAIQGPRILALDCFAALARTANAVHEPELSPGGINCLQQNKRDAGGGLR